MNTYKYADTAYIFASSFTIIHMLRMLEIRKENFTHKITLKKKKKETLYRHPSTMLHKTIFT